MLKTGLRAIKTAEVVAQTRVVSSVVFVRVLFGPFAIKICVYHRVISYDNQCRNSGYGKI